MHFTENNAGDSGFEMTSLELSEQIELVVLSVPIRL